MPLLETIGSSSALSFGLGSIRSTTAGSFYLIETQNLGSQASFVEFNSIPQTYKHLQVRATIFSTSWSSGATLRFNGDTSATNYRFSYAYGDGTGSGGGAGEADNAYAPYFQGGNTSEPGMMILDIPDYKRSYWKTFRCLDATLKSDGSGYIEWLGGRWENTSSISSIRFNAAGAFSPYTRFSLYGVK